MGPVSFESIPAGTTRAEALERAGRLAEAGIRVLSVTEGRAPGGPAYRLTVGAADAARARALLGVAAGPADDQAGGPGAATVAP